MNRRSTDLKCKSVRAQICLSALAHTRPTGHYSWEAVMYDDHFIRTPGAHLPPEGKNKPVIRRRGRIVAAMRRWLRRLIPRRAH
jgi:hypothetical protein